MENTLALFMILLGATVTRYFVIAGLAFFLFYKVFRKAMQRKKIQDKEASIKDFIREIGHSVQTTFVMAIFGLVFLFSPVREYTRIYNEVNEYPLWWIPLSIILCLILHDTYFYFMHRAIHHKSLFKRVHLLHHRSVNPSPWASYSFHFWEAWLENGILVLIIFVLPLHPVAIAGFVLSSFIINVYGHLGYEIMPRWFRHSFLFEILNTSVYHNLHHSKFKGNYGLYFRVWDRLLQTEHPDYVQQYDKIQNKRFETIPFS